MAAREAEAVQRQLAENSAIQACAAAEAKRKPKRPPRRVSRDRRWCSNLSKT